MKQPFSLLAGLLVLLPSAGCTDRAVPEPFRGIPVTVSSPFRSEQVANVQILAYDSGGSLNGSAYTETPDSAVFLPLLADTPYYLYALANCGKIDAPSSLAGLGRWSLPVSDVDSARHRKTLPQVALAAGPVRFTAVEKGRLAGTDLVLSDAGIPLQVAVDPGGVSGFAPEIRSITLEQPAVDLQPFNSAAVRRDGILIQQASPEERKNAAAGTPVRFLLLWTEGDDSPRINIETGVDSLCRCWSYRIAEDSGLPLPLSWAGGYTLTLHLSGDSRNLTGRWTLRKNNQSQL